MDFNEIILKYLESKTIITEEVGEDIYNEVVEEEFLYNYPLIVFTLESIDIEETFNTQDDCLQKAELRIDIYSDNRADTLRIAKKVIKVFRNIDKKLTSDIDDNLEFSGSILSYQQNGFERLSKGKIEYRTILLFDLHFNEV